MKSIPLTQGQTALIDDVDFEKVGAFKWCAQLTKGMNSFYATRRLHKNKNVLLHRVITGAKKNEIVDHINHNTLDNRRSNLRIVTPSQNSMNRKGPQSNSSSGIRGVYWESDKKKWYAAICAGRKQKNLGRYNLKCSAIVARKLAESIFHVYPLNGKKAELEPANEIH